MLPKFHLIISFVISFILLILGVDPIFCLLFFLAGFLIDFDHYVYYVKKKKDISLINAYYYHKNYLDKELERKNQKSILMVLHTIEFLIILLILSIFFKIIWPIFLGCLSHILTDFIYRLSIKNKKYKQVYSIIFYAKKTGVFEHHKNAKHF